MKYKKLLLVEDGSVDLEKITEDLKDEPIYIILYRQGARIPEVIDLTDDYKGEQAKPVWKAIWQGNDILLGEKKNDE